MQIKFVKPEVRAGKEYKGEDGKLYVGEIQFDEVYYQEQNTEE